MTRQPEQPLLLKFTYDENIDEIERHKELEDLKQLQIVAEKGDIEAQLLCAKNATSERKLVDQCSWYYKAANLGNAEAQKQLGDCYFYGIGISENLDQAIYWYKKAVEQNYLEAQFELAELYFNKHKLEKNTASTATMVIFIIVSIISEIVTITFALPIYASMIIIEKTKSRRKVNNPCNEIWEMLDLYHKAAEEGHIGARERLAYIYKLQEN